jgi:hypothetical protein
MPGSKTKEFGMQKLLTQAGVAKLLGISPNRVRQYTRAGLLDYVSLPGFQKPRYTEGNVEAFIERRTRKCHANENSHPISGGNLAGRTSTISSM